MKWNEGQMATLKANCIMGGYVGENAFRQMEEEIKRMQEENERLRDELDFVYSRQVNIVRNEELKRLKDKCREYWDADSFQAVDIAMEIVDKAPGLISEIERLREENEHWKKDSEEWARLHWDALHEREKYWAELQFYANDENWKGILSGESAVLADGGERAKRALGVKEDD